MRQLFARRPEVLLVLVTILWGSTFVVTEDILETSQPLGYLALRFTVAALVLFALFPRALRGSRQLFVDGLVLGLAQGIGLFLQRRTRPWCSRSSRSSRCCSPSL